MTFFKTQNLVSWQIVDLRVFIAIQNSNYQVNTIKNEFWKRMSYLEFGKKSARLYTIGILQTGVDTHRSNSSLRQGQN